MTHCSRQEQAPLPGRIAANRIECPAIRYADQSAGSADKMWVSGPYRRIDPLERRVSDTGHRRGGRLKSLPRSLLFDLGLRYVLNPWRYGDTPPRGFPENGSGMADVLASDMRSARVIRRSHSAVIHFRRCLVVLLRARRRGNWGGVLSVGCTHSVPPLLSRRKFGKGFERKSPAGQSQGFSDRKHWVRGLGASPVQVTNSQSAFRFRPASSAAPAASQCSPRCAAPRRG
jgi:hypothetical protein